MNPDINYSVNRMIASESVEGCITFDPTNAGLYKSMFLHFFLPFCFETVLLTSQHFQYLSFFLINCGLFNHLSKSIKVKKGSKVRLLKLRKVGVSTL